MIANLSKNLKEIRIHLCQTSPGSNGARYNTLIKELSYPEIPAYKSKEPKFPHPDQGS
jgi:hypothetical protein